MTPESVEKAPALNIVKAGAFAFAGVVGEGAGLDDVHAPGGEGSGHVGKEAGAIAGDDGEVEELAVRAEVELDGVLGEVESHLEVMADLLGEAGLQIALGQAFKESPEGLDLGGRDHGADAVEQSGVDGGVVADLVHTAVHEVGGGHVELPEVLGLPGSEGVRVDGLDVGEGHDGEHFEELGAADLLREAAHVFKVEDVAAQGEGHFEVEADELEDGLALLGIEVQTGEEGVGQFDALAGVLAGAAGLAGVMEQEGQEKEVEAVNLRQ